MSVDSVQIVPAKGNAAGKQMVSETQIIWWILETTFLILYAASEIRKAHYVETKAEMIDYHIDRGSLRHWISMMVVTYRYHQNGVEYIESEEVAVSKRKLADAKTCLIYVNPNNGKKFVTPFRITMWRRLTLLSLLCLILSMIVDVRTMV